VRTGGAYFFLDGLGTRGAGGFLVSEAMSNASPDTEQEQLEIIERRTPQGIQRWGRSADGKVIALPFFYWPLAEPGRPESVQLVDKEKE
jgi:hypothetical protein